MPSILTLNIRHGQGSASRHPGKTTPWNILYPRKKMAQNARALGRFIKKLRPDVVCLQEGNFTNPFWPDVVRIIKEEAGFSHMAGPPHRLLRHNNAILTNLDVTDTVSQQFRNMRHLSMLFRKPHHYFMGSNRGFVAAHVLGIGWVFSTHLQAFEWPEVRKEEALEIRTLAEQLHKTGQPIIVAGDLNTWKADEPCLGYLMDGSRSLPGSLVLKTEPPLSREFFTSQATYPAGDLNDTAVTAACRLDYILISEQLKVQSVERVHTGLTDHYGLIMRFGSERF